MAKNPHVIIYNAHTGRYEVWHESRCEAHATSLEACKAAYPSAVISQKLNVDS